MTDADPVLSPYPSSEKAVFAAKETHDELDTEARRAMALLHLARRLVPAMVEAGDGAVVVTGNTSALRGKPRFAGFAPTKAAQRILAESIAREVGPKGVHVAYLVIDAVIDLEWTRKAFGGQPDDFFISPAAVAEEVWRVAHQERCAWSFNVEVRPFRETW